MPRLLQMITKMLVLSLVLHKAGWVGDGQKLGFDHVNPIVAGRSFEGREVIVRLLLRCLVALIGQLVGLSKDGADRFAAPAKQMMQVIFVISLYLRDLSHLRRIVIAGITPAFRRSLRSCHSK